MGKKLGKLEVELEQLTQRKLQKVRQVRQERDRITQRRRFLLGKFMEQWMETDKLLEEKVLRELSRRLDREQDRQLFGLTAADAHEETQESPLDTSATDTDREY